MLAKELHSCHIRTCFGWKFVAQPMGWSMNVCWSMIQRNRELKVSLCEELVSYEK